MSSVISALNTDTLSAAGDATEMASLLAVDGVDVMLAVAAGKRSVCAVPEASISYLPSRKIRSGMC